MDFGIYNNPDEIAKTLDGNYLQNAKSAQKIASEKRSELLTAGISHSFETVISHNSKIEYIVSARNKGFHVALYYFWCKLSKN